MDCLKDTIFSVRCFFSIGSKRLKNICIQRRNGFMVALSPQQRFCCLVSGFTDRFSRSPENPAFFCRSYIHFHTWFAAFCFRLSPIRQRAIYPYCPLIHDVCIHHRHDQ